VPLRMMPLPGLATLPTKACDTNSRRHAPARLFHH
jgi:hypothetical protein